MSGPTSATIGSRRSSTFDVTPARVCRVCMTSRSYDGRMSNNSRTLSSISRCWPVTATTGSKSAAARIASTSGAILTASGRVPNTSKTLVDIPADDSDHLQMVVHPVTKLERRPEREAARAVERLARQHLGRVAVDDSARWAVDRVLLSVDVDLWDHAETAQECDPAHRVGWRHLVPRRLARRAGNIVLQVNHIDAAADGGQGGE